MRAYAIGRLPAGPIAFPLRTVMPMSAAEEAWSIGRLLQWTTDYLRRHQVESPRLDAEVLLAEAVGCKRIELYTRFDEVPGESVRQKFREFVRQRAQGRPVAYLIGHREFFSLDFTVSDAVLIPRPETEFVVVALRDRAQAAARPSPLVADVGTGSGVLAVCAARYLPGSRVVACDTSRDALAVAAANAQRHGVADRIRFFQSDLLADVPADEPFDFIVSNPPYVSEAEYERLPADVRLHEPRAALLSGPQGTEVIERLAAEAVERLRPGGWLLVEISPMIHQAVTAVFSPPQWQLGETVMDLARLPRVVQAMKV